MRNQNFLSKHKKFLRAATCLILAAIVLIVLTITSADKKSDSDISVSSEGIYLDQAVASTVDDVFGDISNEIGVSREFVITGCISLMVLLMLPILFIVFRPKHDFNVKADYNSQFMSKKSSGYLEELRQMQIQKNAELKKSNDDIVTTIIS